MGHIEGRRTQESYVHDDGTRWNNTSMTIQLDEKTWMPVSKACLNGREDAVTHPTEASPEVVPDAPERLARRAELNAMDYQRIRRDFKMKSERGLNKEKLIEAILIQEGL